MTETPSKKTATTLAEMSSHAKPLSEMPACSEPSSETPSSEKPLSETPPSRKALSETPLSEKPLSETPSSEKPLSETPPYEKPLSETPSSEKPLSEALSSKTVPPFTENPPRQNVAGPSTQSQNETTSQSTGKQPADGEAGSVALALESVVQLLGNVGGAKYRKARTLTISASMEVGLGRIDKDNGERLEEATRLFVELLSSVGEEKQGHVGFAELLLGYGKALICFVQRNGATSGVLGDAVGKKEEESKQDAAAEEDVEDEDDEELAWTQLEAARVIFERHVKKGENARYRERLGDVHATLGELLLEADAWDGAAREFATAATMVEGRYKAEVLYKRYLALRRDAAQEALVALRDSIKAFEQTKDESTLSDLRDELRAFEKAVLGAIRKLEKEKSDDKPKVVVVQPRKRAKKE